MAKRFSRNTWAPIRTTLHGSAAILSMVGIVSVVNVGYYLYSGDRDQLRAEINDIMNSPERGIVASSARFLGVRLFPSEYDSSENAAQGGDPIPVGLASGE